MEDYVYRKVLRINMIPNITYIFMKGRNYREVTSSNTPNDFYYFYDKFQSNTEYKVNLLEVNSKKKLNIFNFVYKLYEKNLRRKTNLSFYGNEFLSVNNIKTVLKSDKIILVNESVSFSLLLIFSVIKKFKDIEISIFLMGLFTKIDSEINLHKRIFYKMMNIYDKFIFLGEGEYKFANNNYPEMSKKFYFLPFSVDQDFWKYENISTLEKNKILFLGNDINRDFEFAFNVAKNCIDREFLFVSNYFNEYHNLDNLEIISSDWANQLLSDSEIKKIFNQCLITLVPLKESLQPSGQSVSLQSMSMGVPVLITKTEGFWDNKNFENKKNIIFINKNEVNVWKKNIDEILSNHELYKNLSKNAKNTMLETYNQETLFNNFKKIIFD